MIAMPAAEVIEDSATEEMEDTVDDSMVAGEAADPNLDPSDPIPASHRGMDIQPHEDLMPEELTEPVPTVTEIPMIEPAGTTQWVEQAMVIGASDSEAAADADGLQTMKHLLTFAAVDRMRRPAKGVYLNAGM